MKTTLVIFALALSLFTQLYGQSEWSKVEEAFGRKGTVQGNMLKVTFPRSDLHVVLDSVGIEPGLALTSWIAFMNMGDRSMMMGDMVLLEGEIPPVMKRLDEASIEVTALHNHLLRESPTVMYMHVSASGDPAKLAGGMKTALEATGTPLGAVPSTPAVSATGWGRTAEIVGAPGRENGNLLQFSIPRADTILEGGMEIPPFMGMATGITFQRAGDRTAVTGDFVLTAGEVNGVRKSLVAHGLGVTAVHNHMLHESPRLFFMHFWGVGDPEKLAEGLHSALKLTHSRGM